MRFYSGFLLRDEQEFFRPWLKERTVTLAGFSYGAILAFEEALRSKRRIDTLQLFSPAFFLDKSAAFKRLQLSAFQKDPAAYREAFLRSCFAPYAPQPVSLKDDGIEDLRKLLYFAWPETELRSLTDRGIRIEVYLGERDAVIDAEAAREYFLSFATVHSFKKRNHFLRERA